MNAIDKAIEQADDALAILETDFCIGVENRAINNKGILEQIYIIRTLIDNLKTDTVCILRQELKAMRKPITDKNTINSWGNKGFNDCIDKILDHDPTTTE